MELVLTVNPTYSQYTQAVYQRLEEDVARLAPEAVFVNWADSFEEIGLDPERHLYDGGHLNADGAQIFSDYTGKVLLAMGCTPREQTAENAAAWEKTAAYWAERNG